MDTGSVDQDHNANPKFMPKLAMLTGCLPKCHGHLGNSWGGPNFQIGVSLDDTEGGEVSLPKAQTC